MGNQRGNILAELAGRQEPERAGNTSKRETESESPEAFASRLQGRAERIKNKIAGWDRDELADRYAWMLLLALEQRKTFRAVELTGELGQQVARGHAKYARAIYSVAREELQKNMRAREPLNDERAKRSKVASANAAEWQRRAAALWAKPQHRDKSKSAIAHLIDPRKANTIRRKIHKPEK